jgi:Fe2+ transport system protein B
METVEARIKKALAESDENQARLAELVKQSKEQQDREAAERSRKTDAIIGSTVTIAAVIFIFLYVIFK